jgi:hypothetical protein
MNEANDKKASQVLNYRAGRFALVVLPSEEQILISIGTSTVKILAKRAIFGWYLPKVVVSQRLSVWQPDYQQYNAMYRRACCTMILDGLLTLLSHYQSIDKLRQAWPTMQNPLAVVGREVFQKWKQDEQHAKDDA